MQHSDLLSDPTPHTPSLGRRLLALAGVLLVCAAVRVWLVTHTEVVAKDGAEHVLMAQAWQSDPGRVIQDSTRHVAYPAAMAVVQPVLVALGGPEDITGWDLSGQIISAVAGVAAMAAVWLLALLTFNDRVAWIAALLFGIGRKWAGAGADVLSGAMMVCLAMWAAALAIVVANGLHRRRRWALALAAPVGVLIGAAYLVRVEALHLSVVVAGAWLILEGSRRKRWGRAIAASAIMLATTLLTAAPYMLAIGTITKRKSVHDFLISPTDQSQACRAGFLSPVTNFLGDLSLVKFVGQLSEAMHPLVAILACLWVVTILIAYRRRNEELKKLATLPRPAGATVMFGSFLIMAPLLIVHHSAGRSLSHRYTIFTAALLSPLAGAGVVLLSRAAALLAGRRGPSPAARLLTPTRIARGLTAVLAVCMLAHTLRPLHEDKGYLRRAGLFIAETAAPDDVVLTNNVQVHHYAQRPGRMIPCGAVRWDQLFELVFEAPPRARYVALSERDLRGAGPELLPHLQPPAFHFVRQFVQENKKEPYTVRLYRVGQPPTERPDPAR